MKTIRVKNIEFRIRLRNYKKWLSGTTTIGWLTWFISGDFYMQYSWSSDCNYKVLQICLFGGQFGFRYKI